MTDMNKLVLLLSIFSSAYAYGQKDTITSSVNWPIGIAEHNNYLFIAEANDNEITKIDLSIPDPTPIPVIGGLSRPNYLTFDGNYLYFTELEAGIISKIDVNQTNPIKDTVVSGLNFPQDLLLHGTDLYFTTQNSIFKIDISVSSSVPSLVLDGLDFAMGLALNGDQLYYSEFTGNKISRIDLLSTDPLPSTIISGLNGPLGSMKINGTDLYFFEYNSDEISSIDISSSTPAVTNIDVGVTGADFEFVGSDMYVSDFQNNFILKYANQIVLNIETISNPDFQIYPNPSIHFIGFKGLPKAMNCTIFNSLGSKIKEVLVSDSYKLDIDFLKSGQYFIVFENGWSKTFIKE